MGIFDMLTGSLSVPDESVTELYASERLLHILVIVCDHSASAGLIHIDLRSRTFLNSTGEEHRDVRNVHSTAYTSVN